MAEDESMPSEPFESHDKSNIFVHHQLPLFHIKPAFQGFIRFVNEGIHGEQFSRS